jgi:hypothetical protein
MSLCSLVTRLLYGAISKLTHTPTQRNVIADSTVALHNTCRLCTMLDKPFELVTAYRFADVHQSDELLTIVLPGIEPRAPSDLWRGVSPQIKTTCLCRVISPVDTAPQYHV